MTDKDAWERPAITELYDWILTNRMVALNMSNHREVAIWLSHPANSKGFSPFFIDYCKFVIENWNSEEQIEF